MFPYQEHVWFIGYVFYTPCPTCTFLMPWSCFALRHHVYTPLLPLPCLSLYLISSSLACYVYFMLCSIFLRCFVFCLSFIFSFILYPSCIIILVHIFFSFPHFSWPICLFLTKRGRVFQKVYQKVLSFLYDSCAHSQWEKFHFLCTFLMGEIPFLMHIRRGRKSQTRCIYQGRRHFL